METIKFYSPLTVAYDPDSALGKTRDHRQENGMDQEMDDGCPQISM